MLGCLAVFGSQVVFRICMCGINHQSNIVRPWGDPKWLGRIADCVEQRANLEVLGVVARLLPLHVLHVGTGHHTV